MKLIKTESKALVARGWGNGNRKFFSGRKISVLQDENGDWLYNCLTLSFHIYVISEILGIATSQEK